MLQIDGLVSGLDTSTIISQLMELERQPLVSLENKKKLYELEQDLVRSVASRMLSFKSDNPSILSYNNFHMHLASSTDPAYIPASLDNTVTDGTYEISVSQLATATRLRSSSTMGAFVNTSLSMTDGSAGFHTYATTGVFTSNGQQIQVSSGDSLEAIINKINNSSAGVWASDLPSAAISVLAGV